jgi:hypothetical protein
MQSLQKELIPRCFGRYLMDLPDNLYLSTEGGQRFGEITVDIVPMSRTSFDSMLQSRRAQLQSSYLPGVHRYPVLKEVMSLSGSATGLLFDRAESDGGSSRMGRTLELLAWREGYRILATINATDTDFPEFANDAWIRESKTTTAEQKAQILKLLPRIRGRRAEEIPAGKGACILNGFVSGPAADDEIITLLYQLKGAADVYLNLNTASTNTRDDTLTARSTSIAPLIAENQGKILRSRARSVETVKDGEEVLYKMLGDPNSERQRIMTYNFIFEANNAAGNAAAPLIRLELVNGQLIAAPVQPDGAPSPAPVTSASLSEAEAISLWDAVIPTLRARPGAF